MGVTNTNIGYNCTCSALSDVSYTNIRIHEHIGWWSPAALPACGNYRYIQTHYMMLSTLCFTDNTSKTRFLYALQTCICMVICIDLHIHMLSCTCVNLRISIGLLLVHSLLTPSLLQHTCQYYYHYYSYQ